MRSSSVAAAAILSAACALVSCGPPVMNTPIPEIAKLQTLTQVMDNQATTADPQFKKIGSDKLTEEELSALAAASERLMATSLKTKDFSKGPEFDALATRLHDKADALGKAAAAKDAAAVSAALTEMKATCKECHSKFR
jgi:cytochrome c556